MAQAKPALRETRIEIEIDARIEAVWKALTDAEELTRWFPLEARVKPGAGGTILLSWGPGCEGEAPITVWEPLRHFQWQEPAPAPPEGQKTGRFLSIDWTLESRGGKTIVRLVNSGFLADADWENEYFDSTNYGWGFMLANLRHYLERHASTPRRVAWPRRKVTTTREEAYRRLVGPQGLFVEGIAADLRAGERYALRAATSEPFAGRVEFIVPPRGFCVTVDQLNDALFWLTIEGAAGKHEVQLWLSAYGVAQTDVDAFGRRWQGVLENLLA